jgi:hypothetical protein
MGQTSRIGELSDRVDPVDNTHDDPLREHRPDVALDSQRSIWQRLTSAFRRG